MANFNLAFNLTIQHEGGYANNPADKGGETYQGIARNFWPNWDGWPFLDSIPDKRTNDYFYQLDGFVHEFYKQNFWDKYKLSGIQNQHIANFVFDWVVNSGNAGKQIQIVLVKMGARIVIDGIIGQNTVNAINSVDQTELNQRLVDARVDYYESGVKSGWLDSQFLAGLTKRAKSFADGVAVNVGKHPHKPQV